MPTFYAHYPSKEHLVMQLPTAHDFAALLAGQPAGPAAGRADPAGRAAVAVGSGRPEFREDALARWRIVAATPVAPAPGPRSSSAPPAGVVADALPTEPGGALRPADAIVVNAYMSAYTAGLLAWADGNGERKLEELIEEAFDALQPR